MLFIICLFSGIYVCIIFIYLRVLIIFLNLRWYIIFILQKADGQTKRCNKNNHLPNINIIIRSDEKCVSNTRTNFILLIYLDYYRYMRGTMKNKILIKTKKIDI